jgi:hypothetical protein
MMEPLYWVVRRDLTIALRRRADIFTTLVFFVIVVSLFPLGIGPEPDTLRLIAPGIVWVGALLASMLALEQIFSADHRDGTLEQMLLTPQPVALLVTGKVLAHWLVVRCPADADPFAAAGYPGIEPDRRHRCRSDARPALRRGAAGAARAAPLHPGADLWCRGGRGHGVGSRWSVASNDAWRHPAGQHGACAAGYRGCAARRRRLRNPLSAN